MDTSTQYTPARRPSLADRFSALIAAATSSHARACALLALISLLFFLPGFATIPPVDRDEARFSQASKQMVETGHLVDIRFQDEARHKKPVGIYWLQAAVVAGAQALGVKDAATTIWLYRIPSLLGAIGGVLATYWTALAFVSRRGAIVVALMLASSVLLGVEARLAKTDAVLFACIMLAMGALARAYFAGQRGDVLEKRVAAIFWTAMGVGILIKGPIIMMVVGFAAVGSSALLRSWNWLKLLRPLPGIVWMLLLVLPWFIAIWIETGGSFFAESVGKDMLAKVAQGKENHGAPPGTYLAIVWFTFWPASALLLLSVRQTWAQRRDPAVLFLLMWVVPAWLVFEAVPTKLPHYVLPLFPALAILMVRAMEARALSWDITWLRPGPFIWPAIALLLPLAGVIGMIWLEGSPAFAAWPLLGLAVILAVMGWRFFVDDGAEKAFLHAVLSAGLVYLVMFALVLPSMRTIWPAARLAKVVKAANCDVKGVAAAGYREPSLVFLIGTGLKLTDGAGAAEFLKAGGCRVVIIEKHSERNFLERVDQSGTRYGLVGRIEGFVYNGGKAVSLSVFRSL